MQTIGLNGGFVTTPLKPRQIDQAFPLVHSIAPGLTIEVWRTFAEAMLGPPADPPRGIIALQNRHGYIIGLFSYMADADLRRGRVLTIENFVVMDIFDTDGATDSLLSSMEGIAARNGCSAIHTSLPEAYSNLAEGVNQVLLRFRDGGHRLETLHLRKSVQLAAPA